MVGGVLGGGGVRLWQLTNIGASGGGSGLNLGGNLTEKHNPQKGMIIDGLVDKPSTIYKRRLICFFLLVNFQ